MTIWADATGTTGWKTVANEMWRGAGAALNRFPVPIIFLCIATICAFLELADVEVGLRTDRFVLAMVIAALAAVSSKLFAEASHLRGIVGDGAGIVLGALAGALMLEPRFLWVQEWSLVLGVAATVLLAPYLWRGTSSQFWMFSLRVVFAAVLASLALFLFAGGISATLATVGFLFGLEVDNSIYGYVWAFTGLLAAPVFGLGQLPRDFGVDPGLGQAGMMDRGMRALGDYIAAPLLILYAVILHLYAAKIVLTGALPEGQIGWLVLTYGLCLFGSLLVIYPFLDLARAPTRFLLRFWPTFLVVPLVLLALAWWVRITNFGITPDRYMLILFAVVSAAIVALHSLKRTRGDIRLMVGMAVIALLVASFGPQGARAVSVASQAERFRAIVAEEGESRERSLAALGPMYYLDRENALARIAPAEFSGEASREDFDEIAAAYGIDLDVQFADQNRIVFSHIHSYLSARIPQDDEAGSGGFDVVLQNLKLEREVPLNAKLPDGPELVLNLKTDALTISMDRSEVRFPISGGEFEALQDQNDWALSVSSADGEKELLIIPSVVFASADKKLRSLNTLLLLRSSDWE